MENELVHTASISTRSSPPARGPLSRGTLAFWLLPTLLSGCSHDPVAEGEAIYERTCENCHGADGTAGIQVDGVPAADLTVVIPQFSDDDLATMIKEGIGAMPAQDLQGREVDDVIAYLRATFGD